MEFCKNLISFTLLNILIPKARPIIIIIIRKFVLIFKTDLFQSSKERVACKCEWSKNQKRHARCTLCSQKVRVNARFT